MRRDDPSPLFPPFPPLLAMLPLVLYAALRGWWAPDEPRYAQVARDAIGAGHWLVLRHCDALYPDKPPLVFWLAGLLGAAGGWSEFAMRVPSLLGMVGLALATAAFARRWWGPAEAAWAVVLLLTTGFVAELGGRLQLDPLLAALVTASLLVASRPPTERPYLRALAVGGLAGLGALVKGPVAWLLVALPLFAWSLLDRGTTRDARARRGGVAIAAAAAVLPVLVWALAASAREPSLARELFLGQHLERAAVGVSHPGPVWKHALRAPLLMLPWTPVVLLGTVHAWRARASDSGAFRALCWYAVLLVAFSVIVEKRDLYLLPAYPAVALLGARGLVLGVASGRMPRWIPGIVAGCLALAAVAFVALELAPLPVELGPFHGAAAAAGVLLAAGACATLAPARAGRLASAFRCAAATWLAALVLACGLVVPRIDDWKSAEGFGRALAARPERPADVPCYGVWPEAYRFYGGVHAIAAGAAELDDGRFAQRVARARSEFLAVMREDVWLRVPPSVRPGLAVLADRRVGSRRVLLVGNAAAVESTPPRLALDP